LDAPTLLENKKERSQEKDRNIPKRLIPNQKNDSAHPTPKPSPKPANVKPEDVPTTSADEGPKKEEGVPQGENKNAEEQKVEVDLGDVKLEEADAKADAKQEDEAKKEEAPNTNGASHGDVNPQDGDSPNNDDTKVDIPDHVSDVSV
jgi:hypothetical protein